MDPLLLEDILIATVFVFMLVGIPLAIWIRPSGKSWSILIAIALMLIYYLILNMGLSMVKGGVPLGSLVAFSPNLLFGVLGAGLWWQTLRS
jgi:lipopolysaccharide export LptBFGC system permease protein LptF